MAALKDFQFFPAPPPIPLVPKIAMPNPHNRQPSLNKNMFPKLQTTLKMDCGESVVINIQERNKTSRNDSVDSMQSQNTSTVAAPIPNLETHSRTATPLPPPPALTKPETPTSKKYGAADFRHLSDMSPAPSPDLAAGPATGQLASIPLRSMFPVYNPNVPLSQQSYYPQRGTNIQPRLLSKPEYSSRAATPSQSDIITGGPRTAPPSIYNLPNDSVGEMGSKYSSTSELEKLWEATHGMEASSAVGSFQLEFARVEEAVFTMGPNPLTPFYSLQTFSTNEISISKTSPRKKVVACEILQSKFEAQERREHGGLVTMIFPRLAAMLAIDQATELSEQHQLAPTHRDEVVTAALDRAAQQEACRLSWNAIGHRYELEHPAIGRNARDPQFIASPLSPQGVTQPVLHITVSTQNAEGPLTRPPTIMVTNPSPVSSTPELVGAGIRASVVPQTDIDTPLASLDFGNMTLHIDAHQILDLMPSLFAIDSIVSALLCVSVCDPSTNPVMGSMDLWRPSPKPAPSELGGRSVRSYTGSTYYATLAERDEAEEEARLMKMVHQKDVKKKSGKSVKEKKPKKSKKVEIKEFDLEKLGHYQGGSRKGEELPAVSRGAVEMLVAGLRFVVWLLTTAVEVLVWVITKVTRVVTSEKF